MCVVAARNEQDAPSRVDASRQAKALTLTDGSIVTASAGRGEQER
jgi:hypothetical protein